ncbi:MAG: ankyrin repeat domain-containing protein [Pirellulales bacterium]
MLEGADINAKGKDGRTALHSAAENGHAEAVRFLVSYGAAIHPVLASGETPLMLAEKYDHREAAKVLRESKPTCRFCDAQLHSDSANVCRTCGSNWRDPSNVIQRGPQNKNIRHLEQIPDHWLTERTTVETLEKEILSHARDTYLLEIVREFAADLDSTEELWKYDNGPRAWQGMCGRQGLAIVKDGRVACSLQLGMN